MIQIDWKETAKVVNEAMLRKGIGSEFVAGKAGVDRRTVDRLRKGQKVRIQTLSWIEPVLELEILSGHLSTPTKQQSLVAPAELGGYSLDTVQSYVGNYYLFRRSFDYDKKIVCAGMSIFWDFDRNGLQFREWQNNISHEGRRFAPVFNGDVSIPVGVGITQFVFDKGRGFRRVATCTSLRGQKQYFFKGVLVGINEITDVGFCPATSPIYIEKTKEVFDRHIENPKVGSFDEDAIWHGTAAMELRSASDKFVAGT